MQKAMMRYCGIIATIATIMLIAGIIIKDMKLSFLIVISLLCIGAIFSHYYDKKVEKEMIKHYGEEKFYVLESFAAYWVMGMLLMFTFCLSVAFCLFKYW